MKADRVAGEGLTWWWDQYCAVGDHLYVVADAHWRKQFSAMS